MLEAFVKNAEHYINTSPWLALLAVFIGGALTATSPCVLAMIPLTMSFVAGQREDKPSIWRALGFSSVFVLGLSLTFIVLGMGAALAGKVYGEVSGLWNWVVAVVCLAMGLHLMGVLKVPIPSLAGKVQPKTRGFAGALFLGLLFGFVSAPCAAPLLVVLLTYLAGSGASVAYGGLLLLAYALGHSVLIIVAGTSVGFAKRLIENQKMSRAMDLLRRGAGVVVLLVGLFFGYRGLS